jgi:type VI protein secretion system component Hcp
VLPKSLFQLFFKERNFVMKYNRIIGRMISGWMVLVALMAGISTSRGAEDMYLKLDGIKGEGVINIHKIVHSTNGKFDFGQLPAGAYTIRLTDATGKPVKGSHTGWIEVNSFQFGVAAAPATGTGGTATNTIGAGKLTGKRQHTPIVIKKEMDMSSPLTFSIPPGDVDKNGTTDIQASFTIQKVQSN